MAFNISALDNYVEENRLPLYTKLTAKADSIALFKSVLNVKNVTNINLMDAQAIIADRNCGWNPSGDTTFTARPLKVRRAQLQEQFCIRDLETTFLNESIKARVNGDESFAEGEVAAQILDNIAEKINAQIDADLWTGTSATCGFDGLLAIAEEASATTKVEVGSAASIYDKVVAVYQAVPSAIRRKVEFAMSYSSLDLLIQELITKGLYHPDFNTVQGADSNTIALPGFKSVKIHRVSGLEGSDVIFAYNRDNVFYGCDVESDKDTLESYYDRGDKYWKVSADFNYGVQVAFPDMLRYA